MTVAGYAIIRLLTMTGLPIAPATILATLITEKRPLDLSELSRLTGYAKSHLSTMIRLLEEKKLVERIQLSGRRVVFKVKKDALASVIHNHLDELRLTLHHASEELGSHVESIESIEHGLSALLKRLRGGRDRVD